MSFGLQFSLLLGISRTSSTAATRTPVDRLGKLGASRLAFHRNPERQVSKTSKAVSDRQELFSRLDAWMLESLAPGRATGHHSADVPLPEALVRSTRVVAMSKTHGSIR